MSKNIKDLIDKNAASTYSALRKFYLDVVNGAVKDTKITKEGEIVYIEPSVAVKVEAANALIRMDIDKVQGNAKAKEQENELSAGSDALKQLSALAEQRGKK